MSKHRALLLCLLTLLLWSSCGPAEVEEDDSTTSFFIKLGPNHPAYAYRGLVQKVAGWAAEGDPVGSELLILQAGSPIFRGNWGERDRERRAPWRKNTICRMRSLTNPILATAVLILRKRGRLELSDPIEKYLPEFDSARWGTLTIAQLLSHTSTLPNGGGSRALQEFGGLCDFVAALADDPPIPQRAIVQRFEENNYNVLACLITRVSGMPLEQFLERNIFTPLQMKDTHCDFSMDDAWRDRLASSYTRSASGLGFRRITDNETPTAVPYFHAARGVFSTIVDYGRFVRFWAMGGRVDGKPLLTREEIALGHATPPGIEILPGSYTNAWELFGELPLDTSLPAPFGHFGGDESVALASVEKDLIFVYVTQSRGGETAKAFATAVSELFRAKTP